MEELISSFKDYLIRRLDEDYYLSYAYKKIKDLQPQITKHLIKLWLMPNALDYDHWVKEIKNWLFIIDNSCDVKTKSGRPPAEVLMQRANIPEHRIKVLLELVAEQYNIGLSEKDQTIPKKVGGFWNSLFVELSKNSLDINKFLKEHVWTRNF